jgi:hypothetical protein
VAIGLIFDGAGVTQAQYEQVLNEVMPSGGMPDGMQSHIAGATENGWLVTEVWDSQESAKKFFEEKLGQALQRAKITTQPSFFQVHNILSA